MADYNFIVSPENIERDLSVVNSNGISVGVYSGMSQIVSGNTYGTSLLTGLTVNILLTQSAVDAGYYTPFDGAVMQKDVVSNFIFSSTTSDQYRVYVYNTSSEFQKFLDLSKYVINWGDGSQLQAVTTYTPNSISHVYPSANKTYTITLTQTNPWGVVKVQKNVTLPYSAVTIYNQQGTAYFTPAGGNWFGTPVSYDYIFSGDAVNVVSAQTTNNFEQVPFIVSGVTTSRVTELALYGNPKYQVGVPVIKNGEIWGVITNMSVIYTAYTITGINFYDYADGTSIFFQESSGFTDSNLTAVPITKLESLLKVMDQPQIQTDVFLERGKNSAYERVQRLGEVDNLGDLLNYGYGFFNVQKAP
jgi:hypothetical protein